MNNNYIEANIDRLIGPTYHFGGYAHGNLASQSNKKKVAHPKKAAMEGLNKMKRLVDLGMAQIVLPPPMRPPFTLLRSLGYEGSNLEIFNKMAHDQPKLLALLSSSSAMWTANAATFSPSCDAADHKAHLTIANLVSHFHRSIEAEENYHLFSSVFPDNSHFVIHPALPKAADFGDEGAANHTRFAHSYGEKGCHLFVYGRTLFEPKKTLFPTRQTKEATEAIARQHRLDPATLFYIQQNPELIDVGVFHNDVISVGNRDLFIYHEKAFLKGDETLKKMEESFHIRLFPVTEKMLTIQSAVQSYFFNGQLITLPDGTDCLILPKECEPLNLDWFPFKREFVDVSESMRNGGGPGCLRLRTVLNETEKSLIPTSLFLNEDLYQRLVLWITKYYPDQMQWEDLLDPHLLNNTLEALDALSHVFGLNLCYE